MEKLENIKLVVADIDNTLVKKHQPLSPLATSAIKEMNKRGIYFALASGRSVEQLHALEDDWGIKCELLIGMNGCEIYDGLNNTTETLYYMKADWVRQAFAIMKPFRYNAHVRIGDTSYISAIDENTQSSAKYVKGQNMKVVDDESEFWSGDTIKIGFRVHAEDMPAIEKRVAEFPSDDFIGGKTEFTMFEFWNKQANKGKILDLFCKRHDIPLSSVVAVGDMTNDISMIEVAGIGVCMLNGSDDTKAVSQMITEKTCDEDGFAHFIYDHILND